MATYNFSPILNAWQGFTPSGLPLANGFVQTYQAGTTTPLNTYTTSVGNVPNANPISLLADGRTPQEIWLDSAFAYKFVILDALLNQIATYDNIVGIDNTVPAALTEWVLYAPAPSFVSATTFTLAGNQTALFEIGRRVRYTLSGGQFTGSITNSVFGAVTTITVATDSIPLDATLSTVAYGFLDALKPSTPTAFLSTVSAPTLSITGNTTLGDAAADTATINATTTFPLAVVTQTFGATFGNVVRAGFTTLDWYEEDNGVQVVTVAGTTTAGTAAYSQQSIKWQRVGNRVNFNISVIWTALTGTGNLIVLGMPYPPADQVTSLSINAENLVFANQLGAILSTVILAAGRIELTQNASGAPIGSVPVDAAGSLWIQGSYRV